MNVIAVLLLLVAIALTRTLKLRTAVTIIFVQSLFLAVACVAAGWETGSWHMYIAALLTVVFKALVIPYALLGVVKRLRRDDEKKPLLTVNHSSLAACIVIALAYALAARTLPSIVSHDALAAALSLVLIGLLIIMTRRQAMLQIAGLLTMENGLYLLGLSATQGLPLVIELGIFFDVLVAVGVLVLLTYQLKLSFATTDTSVLKQLKG